MFVTAIVTRLQAAGMSEGEALAKAQLFECCVDALGAPARAADRAAFFVPGRIEVLGKHTDYAGGPSLLCAVEQGLVVLVAPRADARVRVVDAARDETREMSLNANLAFARGDWSNYVATVVRRVARDFPDARRGADIAFASDLPAASGLSSSSALVIAIFLALDAANRLSDDAGYQRAIASREALGEYLGAVENGRRFGVLASDLGVGTFGGSEDHTAILCCRAGVLSHYSFCPVRAHGDVPFPPGRTFVVAYSGVAAEKASGALARYNEAALAVQRIVAVWNQALGRTDTSLADAVASAPAAADHIRALLRGSSADDFTPQRLLDRFDQYMAESYDIIPRAADAFRRADLAALGEIVDRSQRSAESLLGNQVAETIALARLARERGADAASAFGAGFGGSVWSLVAAADANRFAASWRDAYNQLFPAAAERAKFFVTGPGPGALRL